MATIGQDCEVIIDSTGYFVEPHFYGMKRSRVRKSTVAKGGQARYVESGSASSALRLGVRDQRLCARPPPRPG